MQLQCALSCDAGVPVSSRLAVVCCFVSQDSRCTLLFVLGCVASAVGVIGAFSFLSLLSIQHTLAPHAVVP
jgi:hypothetical protein